MRSSPSGPQGECRCVGIGDVGEGNVWLRWQVNANGVSSDNGSAIDDDTHYATDPPNGTTLVLEPKVSQEARFKLIDLRTRIP